MINGKYKKRISNTFLAAAASCFLFGAGVTVMDVILRAVAGMNVPAAIELTSLSIGLGALLSMPVCYAKRTHVTAKLLSELSPNRFTRPLGIFGSIASLIFAGLLFWILAENTLSKFGSPETTADLGVPVSMALMVVTLTLLAALVAALAAVWFSLKNEKDW
ncbi:MAG: TRAP transporter small permease [Alphaproteobacteria bacterium]|nr:TRAP transporter small permease [Alphaproteobacteria bacterium]MBU1280169.1 TRAP transporter small permease [Alphaproteobacteria bacterium]MBU1575379.1 TRAP transporter small permease [Alphaproteobacteria bacterium]MBU1830423.1 TRAP transporter small permease [Alphaproteobacteria bacterium]MBU2077587.1 TRAP transporter small permease [Alphaproteobacteria bacterium]